MFYICNSRERRFPEAATAAFRVSPLIRPRARPPPSGSGALGEGCGHSPLGCPPGSPHLLADKRRPRPIAMTHQAQRELDSYTFSFTGTIFIQSIFICIEIIFYIIPTIILVFLIQFSQISINFFRFYYNMPRTKIGDKVKIIYYFPPIVSYSVSFHI